MGHAGRLQLIRVDIQGIFSLTLKKTNFGNICCLLRFTPWYYTTIDLVFEFNELFFHLVDFFVFKFNLFGVYFSYWLTIFFLFDASQVEA